VAVGSDTSMYWIDIGRQMAPEAINRQLDTFKAAIER
jgi:hypothetical protein